MLHRAVAFEAAKLFGCDDDDLITAMHGDVLRPFAADAAHQFAETRLGVLQQPVARPVLFLYSSHTD